MYDHVWLGALFIFMCKYVHVVWGALLLITEIYSQVTVFWLPTYKANWFMIILDILSPFP